MIFKNVVGPKMVTHIFNPLTGVAESDRSLISKASQVYRSSSRRAKETQRNPVLNHTSPQKMLLIYTTIGLLEFSRKSDFAHTSNLKITVLSV